MQRKQDGLVPIGEALADLDGPVKAIRVKSAELLPRPAGCHSWSFTGSRIRSKFPLNVTHGGHLSWRYSAIRL